jgi:hypothetical protein
MSEIYNPVEHTANVLDDIDETLNCMQLKQNDMYQALIAINSKLDKLINIFENFNKPNW